MPATLVQVEQPRPLSLLCRVVQQTHWNQQRSISDAGRFLSGEYAGEQQTRGQWRQPDRLHLTAGSPEPINALGDQRSADLRPGQLLFAIIKLFRLGETVEDRQQQRSRPRVCLLGRCCSAGHRPGHITRAEPPVDRGIDFEIAVARDGR